MEGSFGQQLKTLRGRVKHLKQSDVAKRLNVSVASVNYWENDFNKPTMRNLKSLIALLCVEGAFTSAAEIAQFWQATPVPLDEVWLAHLIKQDVPDPELALAYAADAGALPSQEEQPPSEVEACGAPGQSPASTVLYQNRLRLLHRVRSFWITGVLDQSLDSQALITLGFQEQPDAVANPWRFIIQESEQASTPLPAGTRITDIYDEAGGELLILGEPGAGKTTLLLELCRELLFRAEQEQTHPMPVVFNLSSWRRKRQPLATWLIEELETKYLVPRRVGSDWIDADQILPLLDGLDEVDAATRPACMQAIDAYHRAHSIVPLVVCCRVNEYLWQATPLALCRAVTIQKLSNEQINAYLVRIGEKVAALRTAFQSDAVLQELATTPLMLTILILAYQDVSLAEIKGSVSAEDRREQIFATYTDFWLPQHMGSSIKPLGLDSSAVSIMSHLLGFSPHTLQAFWTLHALFWGLVNGAIPALAVGLYCGGAAFVQHFVLRCLLWCAGCIPFNYARFLDYAAERILLRKVGGGYMFMHRLLLEYFAGVQAEAPPSAAASPTRGPHTYVQSAGA